MYIQCKLQCRISRGKLRIINNAQLTKEKGIKGGNMKTDDKYESKV